MAVEAKVGSFEILSSWTAGATHAESGFGFANPIDVVIFFWGGPNSATNSVGAGDHDFGVGWMIDASNRVCHTRYLQDNQNPPVSANRQFHSACIGQNDTSGNSTGAADFSAAGTGGFTIVVDTAFTRSMTVNFIAIAGLDNVSMGRISEATTGQHSYTDPGFTPDALLSVFGFSSNDFDSGGLRWIWSLGAAAAAAQEWTIAAGANVSNSGSRRYGFGDEWASRVDANSDNVYRRLELETFDTLGFTTDWLRTGASDWGCYYLALKGGLWMAGDDVTRTNTTPWDITTTGMDPVAVLVGSHIEAENTQNVTRNDAAFSVGASDGTDQVSVGCLDEDLASPTNVVRAIDYGSVYVNPGSAGSLDGKMGVNSLGSEKFTVAMGDADPSANFFGWLAVGNAPGGSSTPIGAIRQHHRLMQGA